MNINLAPYRDRHYGEETFILGKNLSGKMKGLDIVEHSSALVSGALLPAMAGFLRQPDYVFAFEAEQLINESAAIYGWAEKNPEGTVFLPESVTVHTAAGSEYRQSFDTQDFSSPNVELVNFRDDQSDHPYGAYYKNLAAGMARSEFEILIMLDFAIYMGFNKIHIGVAEGSEELYEGNIGGSEKFNNHLEQISLVESREIGLDFVRIID